MSKSAHSLNAMVAKFHERVAEVGRAMRAFPLEQPAAYSAWLAQTYFLVRHTTRFLTIGASNAPLSDRALHYDMIHHLKGELHHDQVALDDLTAMGHSVSEYPELIETSLLYQTQYYWLDKHEVSSLMGYALMLEGLACEYGKTMIDKSAVHGKKATAFIRLHAQVDVGHFADGLKSLEQYPDVEHEAIIRNLDQSTRLYIGMLDAIKMEHKHHQVRPSELSA